MPAVAIAIPAMPRRPTRSPRKMSESRTTASGETAMIHAELVAVVLVRPASCSRKWPVRIAAAHHYARIAATFA
jgi:hypothetical protein